MPPSKRSSSHSREKRQWKSSHQDLLGNDQNQQKTISELFATSKIPSARLGTATADGVSPTKRLKYSHPTSPPSKPLTSAEMYSFPSNIKQTSKTDGTVDGPEVIDLTGSPSGGSPKPTPTRRRPSGIVRPTTLKPHNGPKKIVVKNLKTTPKADPEQYYIQVWKQLDAALSAIFANEETPYSFEELYKGVESLCRQDYAQPVYRKLREKCKQNVSLRVLEPLVQDASTADAVGTLCAIVKAWSTWTAQLVNHGYNPPERIY